MIHLYILYTLRFNQNLYVRYIFNFLYPVAQIFNLIFAHPVCEKIGIGVGFVENATYNDFL